MSTQQAAWEQLPLGVQQRILVLTGRPCVRRVSKACRDAFDAANDTLCFSHVLGHLKAAATAAATRVVKNSSSLTAVNFMEQTYRTSSPPMLSDLLAAGVTSGLATRLRKLTGIRDTVACDVQQLQVLRQCTGLTHLDISNSDLQGCLPVELRAALQAMPRLTFLRLCNCKLQSQGVEAALASVLQPLTQLQHLHLAGSRLGAAGLVALAPALCAMPGLQTLDVGATWMSGAEGAQALCTLLGAVPGLTHLDVSYTCLRGEGAPLLAALLRGMTCLQTLNMRGSNIGDRGMVALAPAFAALPHLHTLNLSSNVLGTDAVSMLQPVLARQGSPLRELDLSFNGNKVVGALSFGSELSTATQLRGLNLDHAWLGAEGWVALAPALSSLGPSLQSLQLGLDGVSNAGSSALASALKALTGLTRLTARACLTPAAIVNVLSALMGAKLKVLDLRCNWMEVEGTAAFAAAFPAVAGSLTHLNLSYCRIDGEAAANALAPALAQATGLVELRLGGNHFGPQGAQWLVPVLRTLPHLRIVALTSCKLGVQGCMAVARALKDWDGALVDLLCNGYTRGCSGGDELCNIFGIRVHV